MKMDYRQLVAGLARNVTNHHFTLYHTHPLDLGTTLDSRFEVERIRPASPLLRIPIAFPLRLRSARHDVFHAQYILPPACKSRTVLTVHDLAHEHLPQSFRFRKHAVRDGWYRGRFAGQIELSRSPASRRMTS